MNGPKVSILMPCFNSAQYLDRSIGSVISQTYQNWELICIDDESIDDTYDKLMAFAANDNRIKIFRKRNSGRAAPNLNVALEHTTGDFVFLLGHDDSISPDCLEKMVARQIETNADIVIPDLYFVFPDNSQKNWLMAGVVKQFGVNTENPDRNIVLDNRTAVELSALWSIHAFALYRTCIVKRYRFCEEGISGDEYSARVFLFHANKIVFSAGQYNYYQLDDSITKKLNPRLWETWQSRLLLEIFLRKNKFKKRIIKNIEISRHLLYSSLKETYIANIGVFSPAQRAAIEKSLADNEKNLWTPAIGIMEYIIRWRRSPSERYCILFNFIKIKYRGHK